MKNGKYSKRKLPSERENTLMTKLLNIWPQLVDASGLFDYTVYPNF